MKGWARLTSDLSLRPWRAGDEDAFTPRRDFAEERAAVAWPWERGAPPGRTWTLYREGTGEVVGVGGVIDRYDCVEAWASLADLPRRDWPRAIYLADRALLFALKVYELSVIATARADNPAARRVLERLGFRPFAHHEHPRVPGVRYVHMIRLRRL